MIIKDAASELVIKDADGDGLILDMHPSRMGVGMVACLSTTEDGLWLDRADVEALIARLQEIVA